MTKTSELLNVQESAAFLGLSISTIRRWAQEGELQGKKVGSRGDWRFTKEELTKMIRIEKRKFSLIKKLLISSATEIQKISSLKHIQLVGSDRLEGINKHQKEHIRIIKTLAINLENFEKGKKIFTILGEKLAKQAIKDGLSLEATIDGLTFLRQTMWEKLYQEHLLQKLSAEDFYALSHIFSTYTDILTSKLAFSYEKYSEDTLKEQSELLQLTSEAFLVMDINNRIISWNKGAENLYGYTEHEAVGKKGYKLLKTQYPISRKEINHQVRTKGLWFGELIHSTKNGKTIIVDSNWQMLPSSNNSLILEVNKDITARKVQEEKLQKANELTRSILESISDAFYALDKHWNFTYVNAKTLQLWKKKRKNLLGKNIWEVFPQAVTSTSYEKHQEAFKTQKPLSYDSVSPILDNWIEVSIYPSKTGLSVYFHDITERKKLEQRKDDFIALASHELKTPVTSMKMFTQVLKQRLKKAGDTSSADFLNNMDKQLNKLTELVNGLLDVSRFQQGKLAYKEEEFSIDNLIKETIENVQITTNTHEIQYESDTKKKIIGDRDRIGQVVINLLTNAIKYSPEGKKILVTSKDQRSNVLVSVKDFGMGIPKDQQDKIFDRFFQVNNSQVKTYPGLGLGLFISKEIIQRHNGSIWIESTEGKGSTFFFTLPTVQKKVNTDK